MVGIEYKRIIIQILITCFVVLLFFKIFVHVSPMVKLNMPNTLYNLPSKSTEPLMNQLRCCLNLAYYEEGENRNGFIVRYRKCIAKYIPNLEVDKFYMGRFGENKMFLPMQTSYDQTKCNWLTIGVGGADNAEKEFKQKYPECDLFGIEASPDQYAGFEKYGTIIPFGVGVTNGTFELTVREGGSYHKKQVAVLSMAEILDKYVGTRLVHYMTIDIEGFEYGILEELLRGKILAEQGIAFCQIDAELHGGNKDQAADILHKFDTNVSDYLPVITKKFMIHEKVTWVNIKNQECIKAFGLEVFL